MAALGVRPPEWNDNYKAKIKKIFDRCDDDQSGTVSLDELGRALAADKDLCRILGIDQVVDAGDSASVKWSRQASRQCEHRRESAKICENQRTRHG